VAERDEPIFEQLYSQGTKLLQRKKAMQAVEMLELARDLRPEHLDVTINLGGAYILAGQFKSAVKVLEEAVKIEPGSVMAWTNLGAAYLGNPVLARDQEQLKAIAAFQKVLEIQPQTPNVAYNIGLIYRDRQEWGHAVEWFGEAVETDHSDRDARSLLNKTIAIHNEHD
jgi:superkiller protein 3